MFSSQNCFVQLVLFLALLHINTICSVDDGNAASNLKMTDNKNNKNYNNTQNYQNPHFQSISTGTYYQSYPPCCQNQSNYNPNASKEECLDFDGCTYAGAFSAIGQRSLQFVET